MCSGLDKPGNIHYNVLAIGVWRSLVSRMVRVHVASGSNPDTPTKAPKAYAFGAYLFLLLFSLFTTLAFEALEGFVIVKSENVFCKALPYR